MDIPKRKLLANITIKLGSIGDVDDLITDLRETKKIAKKNGGLYRVYRKDEHGNIMVFEIQFSHKECL